MITGVSTPQMYHCASEYLNESPYSTERPWIAILVVKNKPMNVHPRNASAQRAGRCLSMTTKIRRIVRQGQASGNSVLPVRNIPRPTRNKAGAQVCSHVVASLHADHSLAKQGDSGSWHPGLDKARAPPRLRAFNRDGRCAVKSDRTNDWCGDAESVT